MEFRYYAFSISLALARFCICIVLEPFRATETKPTVTVGTVGTGKKNIGARFRAIQS